MTAAARPHRHRTLLAYAATTVALVTLGACSGGDPAPTVTTPPTGSSSTSSTSTAAPTTTTPTPSTTPSVDPVLAKIPAAARPETQAGAAAFATYFFEQLNQSFRQGSPEGLDGLFDQTCEICVDLRESAQKLKLASQHHEGKTLEVSFASATVFNSKERQVLVKLDQFAVPIVDKQGSRVDATKAGSGAFVAVLRFDKHWVITDLGRPS